MYSRNKLIFFLIFFIYLISLFVPAIALAQQPTAPTILEIKDDFVLGTEIIGSTPAGTEVMVYVDGNYTGLAEISSKNTDNDTFSFKYPTMLEAGEHTVWTVARDPTSLLLSQQSDSVIFNIEPLPAPTLIAPNENTTTAKVKPLITGLTVSDTFVHIWIDGEYNGKTEVVEHESGTANFAYQPFLNLAVGEHTVWAVAEDQYGRKSRESLALKFKIEAPLPAPVIFKPVVNFKTVPDKPLIVGVAKNDSLIKVYIDHTLFGQFRIENHMSGTANFAYQPFVALTAGPHFVYTEAVDSRGKVSSWSNIVYFSVQKPAISVEAVEERKDTVGTIQEPEKKEEPAVSITPETGEVEEVEVMGEEGKFEEEPVPTEGEAAEIAELLEGREGEAEETTGLLDESKSRQGGLQLNLIIFIVFLLAVIAWIFWVNRELIKERRALTKAEDEIKKNKSI